MPRGLKIRLAVLWLVSVALGALLLAQSIHAWGASLATLYEPCWMHAGGNYDSERVSIALGECLVSDECVIEYSRSKDMYVPMRRVECGGLSGFVEDRLVTPESFVEEINYPVDGDTCKTWESYKALTSKTSRQWKLQKKAYTDELGFRRVGGRYCIAIGSGYGATVGQWVDVWTEDGTLLPCVMGDQKQDKHTDPRNLHGKANGDHTEWILDPDADLDAIKGLGWWKSPVVMVTAYERWEELE